MPGLIFGRLFDMGYLRLPVAVASALLVLCTFLTAQCTEFWHFLLCQGFGIGVSFSFLATTCSLTSLSGTVRKRDRIYRSGRYHPSLVQQEARTCIRLHGHWVEYRRHHLPHNPEEPDRAPDVGYLQEMKRRRLTSILLGSNGRSGSWASFCSSS